MKAGFYRLTRDLHLYLGLFISPFILVFTISVFFLVHTWMPGLGRVKSTRHVVSMSPLPQGLQKLSGRPLIETLKPALQRAGVHGEVGFVRRLVQENILVIPVTVPGRETVVNLRMSDGEATIETREIGVANALVTLHKSPGQHGPDIRMNWFYMRVWRWMADATVYLILFVTISGVYLWYVLRGERAVGLVLLGAGALSFFGIVYALIH
ncbi:MAG TPA: PepSY-associated TM helix domain-containing protein [Verrucomicrobiae bacterium]|nr:PepSY-associated TM helix domain-containing protein [Verrucomicrobiae bacterium]